jgi:voltage-gated potassium channel
MNTAMKEWVIVLRLTEVKRFSTLYEAVMALLALLAVSISFMDLTGHISITTSSLFYGMDLAILIVFAIDYLVRIILSADRKKFFQNNIFDLLAIIPFSSFFRAFRLARLLRFMRFIRLLKIASILVLFRRLLSRADGFIKTNGLIYVLYITLVTMILGSIGIYYFEFGKTVDSFGDALWWSFVTSTTVGYGDISPITAPGRIIAAILMLTGIGFIGMLTGTIATFFINKKKINLQCYQQMRSIDLSGFSKAEYDDVMQFIEFIKSKR